MKLNNNDLNKLKKDFKDVDLIDINVKIVDLSPIIKEKENDNDEYIDVEKISIETKQQEIKDEDEVYNDDLEDITIPSDKTNEINISSTNEVLEVVIFEELDTMIKTDYNILEESNLEVDLLNKKEEDSNLVEEVKELEKEIEKLIEKFKQLTKKYDDIYENIDYKEIRKISEEYFKYLIDDYATIKNIISKELLEEYVSVVNKIIEIENKKDNLKEKIENKKDKLNIRDYDFEKMKDAYTEIDKVTDNIKDINDELNKSLSNIKELLKDSVKIDKNIEYQKKLSLNVGNAIKGSILLGSSKLFPPTRKGNMFKIAFMIIGTSKLSNLIKEEKKEKITYEFDIKNYEKDITNNIINVDNVINDIENAFIDVDYIRKTIKNDFKEYTDQIPEYKELIKNINRLEKELNIQKEIAKNYSNEFKKSLQENNEKIKRLDKYKGSL